MPKPKRIELPCHRIVIELERDDEGGYSGEITSTLHDGERGEDEGEYDAAIDGIESLLLSMACEGVKLDTPKMIAAIEAACEAAANEKL